MSDIQEPKCNNLVLDAGPLLSLSPLRGLAKTYLTVPQVLAELKDRRAKEHIERLGLTYGVNIEVRNPDPASLTTVIAWAKKTGDYAVLSHPDLCVLALTYSLNEQDKKEKAKALAEAETSQTTDAPSQTDESADASTSDPTSSADPIPTEEGSLDAEETLDAEEIPEQSDDPSSENLDVEEIPVESDVPSSETEGEVEETAEVPVEDLEPLDVELQSTLDLDSAPPPPPTAPSSESPESHSAPKVTIWDDPSDSDDGEGEWITPHNVGLHKSRALDLLPSAKGKGKAKEKMISVGCMTADFAMQNVLLQMGLNLVSTDGQRIQKVKSWVLRCHACYKICKDNSKKFCPSCGNPTLLRTSVTIAAPNASPGTPAVQVHLKSNFQYRIRGTKFSIPAPKAGTSKTGPGEGLILREDQVQYMRAKKLADGKRERSEAKMMKGVLSRGADGDSLGTMAIGSWMDPDWVPEIMSVGSGGKGRSMKSSKMDGDMPIIGHGRKNPNERKRRK